MKILLPVSAALLNAFVAAYASAGVNPVNTRIFSVHPIATLGVAAAVSLMPPVDAQAAQLPQEVSAILRNKAAPVLPAAGIWIATEDSAVARRMDELTTKFAASSARRIHPLEGKSWGSGDLRDLLNIAGDPKTSNLITLEPFNLLVAIDAALRERIELGEIAAFESLRNGRGQFWLVDASFLR